MREPWSQVPCASYMMSQHFRHVGSELVTSIHPVFALAGECRAVQLVNTSMVSLEASVETSARVAQDMRRIIDEIRLR